MHLQEVSRESKIAVLRRLKLGPLSESFPSFGNPLSLRGMQRGLVEQPQKRTAWVNQRICATPQNGEAQCKQSFCFFFFFSPENTVSSKRHPPEKHKNSENTHSGAILAGQFSSSTWTIYPGPEMVPET